MTCFKQFWEQEQVCFLVMRGAPTLITSHNYIGTLRGAPVKLLSYKEVSANDVCDGKREKYHIAWRYYSSVSNINQFRCIILYDSTAVFMFYA